MTTAIINFVESHLEHLDNDTCALSVIGDAAKVFLLEHDECILAAALISAVRVIGAGVGSLREEISRMKVDPTWNTAIVESEP